MSAKRCSANGPRCANSAAPHGVQGASTRIHVSDSRCPATKSAAASPRNFVGNDRRAIVRLRARAHLADGTIGAAVRAVAGSRAALAIASTQAIAPREPAVLIPRIAIRSDQALAEAGRADEGPAATTAVRGSMHLAGDGREGDPLADPVSEARGRAAADRTVADRTAENQAVEGRTVVVRAVVGRTLADRIVADRGIVDQTIAERTLEDRAIADRETRDMETRDRVVPDLEAGDRATVDQVVADRVIVGRSVQAVVVEDLVVVEGPVVVEDPVAVEGPMAVEGPVAARRGAAAIGAAAVDGGAGRRDDRPRHPVSSPA